MSAPPWCGDVNPEEQAWHVLVTEFYFLAEFIL